MAQLEADDDYAPVSSSVPDTPGPAPPDTPDTHYDDEAQYADGDYDDDDYDESEWAALEARAYGDSGGVTVSKSAQLAAKFDSLVSLEPLRNTGISQSAGNELGRTERKLQNAKTTGLSRDERATTEQVLDPRTRLLIFKLLNSGVLGEINGCVSTGKEANVYHAEGRDGELAVKVYKTSVLTFKDRDRYVSGEFRWRHGYCRSNPRKMVRVA
jgi:RIO kinase 1